MKNENENEETKSEIGERKEEQNEGMKRRRIKEIAFFSFFRFFLPDIFVLFGI